MDNVRICIVRQSEKFLGGASVYEDALTKLVQDVSGPTNTVIQAHPRKFFKKSRGDSLYYSLDYFALLSIYARRWNILSFILKSLNLNNIHFEKILKKNKVDLVIFTSPSVLALGLRETPFALPIWDLGHRDLPEFYETSLNGNFENKEYYNSNVLPKASMIITDSEITKQRIINTYGVKSDNIVNLKFSWILEYRNNIIQVHNHKFKQKNFFIYPANFWSHKNHLLLINVFRNSGVKSKNLGLIFTGVDRGNEKKLKKIVKDNNLENTILFYEKINIEKLNYLYSSCVAVLFPSLLGPSNLPPLEAWYYGKVALISDVHTSEEFNSKNFIKLNPFDVDAWISQIINISELRKMRCDEFTSNHYLAKSLIEKHLNYIALKKTLISS